MRGFNDAGYLEVETGLQAIPGGAAARLLS
jgi:lysyl-tRNA synthetase class II